MAKTTQEKIDNTKEKIKQLANEQKQLIKKKKQQERAARTSRLCKRGGLVEKFLPDLISLTDKQFETFVDKVLLTDFTALVVAELTAENVEKPAEQQNNAETPSIAESTEKAAETTAQANNQPNGKPSAAPKPAGEGTTPKSSVSPQSSNPAAPKIEAVSVSQAS